MVKLGVKLQGKYVVRTSVPFTTKTNKQRGSAKLKTSFYRRRVRSPKKKKNGKKEKATGRSGPTEVWSIQ